MKLIADSGSTKTDWCLTDGEESFRLISTQGINPLHQDKETILDVLNTELLPRLDNSDIDSVFFYGSGCRADVIPSVQKMFADVFPEASVEANGDLLGAARALCGKEPGVACILGTGSNSCLYDGVHITANVSPLGYILGDEGSGAVLGRLFINALFKGRLSPSLRDDFLKFTGLTLNLIINKVYCQPLANRFLASTSLFIHKHLDDEQLNELVADNFRSFFKYNISVYHRHDMPVNAIGSMAYYYRSQLAEAAILEGYTIGNVERSPIEGLMRFHR